MMLHRAGGLVQYYGEATHWTGRELAKAVGARAPARRPKRRSRKPTESFEALLRRVGQIIHKDCNMRLGESNACDFSVSFKIGCCCCTNPIGLSNSGHGNG